IGAGEGGHHLVGVAAEGAGDAAETGEGIGGDGLASLVARFPELGQGELKEGQGAFAGGDELVDRGGRLELDAEGAGGAGDGLAQPALAERTEEGEGAADELAEAGEARQPSQEVAARRGEEPEARGGGGELRELLGGRLRLAGIGDRQELLELIDEQDGARAVVRGGRGQGRLEASE